MRLILEVFGTLYSKEYGRGSRFVVLWQGLVQDVFTHNFQGYFIDVAIIRLVQCQRNKSLTHWGRVTHICFSKLTTIIVSDNGLSPGRRQAIIWTNAGILLIGPIGTNFNEITTKNSYIFIQENPIKTVVWKMSAILSWLQCVKDI